MRVYVEQKDITELCRLGFLKDSYKNRWLFSYNDYYLAQFLLYFKQFQDAQNEFNEKYNKGKKLFKLNLANCFIEMEE